MKAIDAYDQYADAVQFMDDTYPFLSTQILNIGKPSFASDIPTACVSIYEGRGIVLDINPDFVGQFQTHDYGFILSHETMHVLLSHLSLIEQFDDQKKFNIAADCIINDFLVSYSIPHSDDLPILHGPDVVGFDCSTADIEDVYDAITDEKVEELTGADGESGFDSHNWQFVDSNGKPLSGDALQKALGDFLNDAFDSLPAELKDSVYENSPEVAAQQADSRPSTGWGNEALTPQLQNNIPDNVSMKWVDLVNTITPDTFKADRDPVATGRTFARPPKKLMSQYPKIVLPQAFHKYGGVGKFDKAANTYVLALDCSGSIADEDRRRFMALAQSLPTDKLNIFAMTFSTYALEFDLTAKNPAYASGGTDFTCIQEWINQNVVPEIGRYPKAVIVITDGEAQLQQTSDEDLSNWHWLLTPGWDFGYYDYSTNSYQRTYNNRKTSDYRVNRVCADQMYNLEDFVVE